MGIVAFSSTIFMFSYLLKYAEYNAGCAIYRNGILGKEICLNSFSEGNFSRNDLEDNISKTLYLLRSREGCVGGNIKQDLNLDNERSKAEAKTKINKSKEEVEKNRKLVEKIDSFKQDAHLTVELLIWFDIIKVI